MAKRGLLKKIAGDLSLPDSSSFSKLLDSYIQSKSLLDVHRLHARIIKSHFASETFILNRLIDAYGKLGSLGNARKVFDRMPQRNIYSWNAAITALTKFGFVDEAAKIFGSMSEHDQCSWNSIISGFAQQDKFEEALYYFVRMHREDFVINEYSFGSALSACSGLKDMRMGTQIHALMTKTLFLSDVYMGSALVDMYGKCGSVCCAQRGFDDMSERNRVSWNSLITCYEQNGPAGVALEVFLRMMDCGIEPDEITLASVVSACASLSAIKEGKQVHARVAKCIKLRDDLVLCNALVDMYAKCSRINEARCVFDRMPVRNVVSETSMVSGYAKTASVKTARLMFMKMMERNIVSWNALIAGYTQNGEDEEALRLFRLLKRESVCPTHYTFGNLLNACANLADLQLGRQAHTHVLKHGFRFQFGEDSDIFVGNSLIDMYMKCGSVEDGDQVFKNMMERDWVSWNAMIVGYAQNGYGNKALELFKNMLVSGEKPDHVTMIGVLCACSHAGLVEEGRYHFSSMSGEHGLVPLKDHYTCMVDLLGRAGCLNEAKNLIETMPMKPDAVVWGSLLGACKIHRDITLGKYVAEKLLEIDPSNSGPYVLLSNMYAELGKWGNVVRVRKLMKKRGVIKQPGCSWIEIQGHVSVFMVKDKRHPQGKEIYSVLNALIKQMKRAGYLPDAADQEAYEEESESKLDFILQKEFAT
ncbi:pentatricopeptide repeat-containing protein At2g13600 [Herrania umbratica]|uniref:Pentatricopeptide repeat-containing protein At2g13600 n=1 Tax=Herrania umbratica TaxID=108875 RepID=A0A6J1BHY6_9ROSI|nr:pentatricopeptide repeat-containing protein At2g13600 [Herrania umbratica]